MSAYYGSGITQNKFKTYGREASKKVCAALKNKKFRLSLSPQKNEDEYTLHDLGLLRGQIAEESQTENHEKFGRPRIYQTEDTHFTTPLLDDYGPFLTEFLNKTVMAKERSSLLDIHHFVFSHDVIGVDARIYGKINGKDVALTGYCVYENTPYWIHTDRRLIKKVLEHVESLIEETTLSAVDLDDPDACEGYHRRHCEN